jgi:hypothetical protein
MMAASELASSWMLNVTSSAESRFTVESFRAKGKQLTRTSQHGDHELTKVTERAQQGHKHDRCLSTDFHIRDLHAMSRLAMSPHPIMTAIQAVMMSAAPIRPAVDAGRSARTGVNAVASRQTSAGMSRMPRATSNGSFLTHFTSSESITPHRLWSNVTFRIFNTCPSSYSMSSLVLNGISQ